MKKFIEDCISRIGVLYYAERKFIESSLDFYQILIKDVNGCYRFIEVFFNDSDIFCITKPNVNNQILIGNDLNQPQSLETKLINSMGIGKDFPDCRKYMIENPTEYKIKKFLNEFQKRIIETVFSIYVKNIEILDVRVKFKPVSVIVINIKDKGVFIPPLKMFLGSKCSKDNVHSVELLEFIDELNNVFDEGDSLCKVV